MNPGPGAAARGRLVVHVPEGRREEGSGESWRDEDAGEEGGGEGSLEGARARCPDLCARYRALWRN